MTTRFDILPGLTPTVVFETGTTFEVVPGGVLTETTSGTINYTLSLATGAYALTGQTATVFVTRKLPAATGSYILTGSAATLIKSYVLAEATGAYTLTGTTLATLTTRKLPGVTGTYTLTGSAASVFVTRKLSGVTGTYFLTGSSATPKLTLKLPLATGAYSLTGSTAATFVTRKLAATSGSYVITGSTATTVVTRKLAAATGAFALSGHTAQVFATRKLAAASGSYVINGQTATLTLTATGHYALAGDTGNYTLSGSTGTLTKVDGSVTTGNIYTVSGPQVVGYLPLQDGVDQVRAVNFPGSTVQRQTTDGTAGPAFQANFTALSALPAQISFSRASNATLFDSTGKLTYAPNNLFTQSNDFSNADWQKSGTASVTGGFADPVGGSSATRLDLPAINDSIGQFVNPFPAKAIHSVWVRSDTVGTIHLLDGSGGAWNLSISVGTTWTLVDTGPQTQTVSLVRVIRESGDLASLYIYNQVLAAVTYETSARSADQVITTSLPYYGPRFGYAFNGSVWVAAGLMDEDQRTNAILQSNNLTDAAWLKISLTVTSGVADPDGGTSAFTLTATANGAQIYQFVAGASGAASFWIRRRTGTGQVSNRINGSTDVALSVTSAWQRLSDVGAGGGGNVYVDLVLATNGDAIDVCRCQLEIGATFPTSYIPTTSAAVTRSADNVNITGSDFTGLYNQPANTFIIEFTMEGISASNQYPVGLSDGAGLTNFLGTRIAGASLTINNSTSAGVLSLTVPTVNVPTRVAFAQAANDHSASQDGGTAVTSTATAAMPTLTRLDFGDLGGPSSIYKTSMWLRGFAAYKTRLSDATLQTKSVVGAAF